LHSTLFELLLNFVRVLWTLLKISIKTLVFNIVLIAVRYVFVRLMNTFDLKRYVYFNHDITVYFIVILKLT